MSELCDPRSPKRRKMGGERDPEEGPVEVPVICLTAEKGHVLEEETTKMLKNKRDFHKSDEEPASCDDQGTLKDCAAVLRPVVPPNPKVTGEGGLEEDGLEKGQGSRREAGEDLSCYQSHQVSGNLLPALNKCLKGSCLVHTEGVEDPVWLGCNFKDPLTGSTCNYWIHARCHGFPHMSKRVAKMTKGFRCQSHLE